MSASDNPPLHQLAKAKLTIRLPRLYLPIVFLSAVGALWLLAASFSPYRNSVSPENAIADVLHNDVPRKQMVLRTTPTNRAGLGSVVAQLRSSAAFATMLGATLSTFGIISEHASQYEAASLLHLDLFETPLDAGTKVCSLATSPNYARSMELVTSWCDNVTLGDAQALELQKLWGGCGLIVDDRPWDVHYDMSKCTWKWVKHIFSHIGLKKGKRGIGLHIRWGDMSLSTYTSTADPLRPERSTPIDKAAQLLRKMRECGVQDELNVYMEMHNTTMLEGLGEPYHIVDTGDSIEDLLDLSTNRLLILDISSWTVLAHQIADGGITIIPDNDLFGINWYDNGVNHVLRWKELLDIPCTELSTLGL